MILTTGIAAVGARLIGAVVCAGALSACENIALMPRATIESPNAPRTVTATIAGIDHGLRELYLRTERNQNYVVNFTTGTQVTSRGRPVAVTDLRAGDLVRAELRQGSGGRLFADEIWLEGVGVASPMRTVEGTVERIVPERGFLELRTINGALVTVYVPESSDRETRRRFDSVRVGDTVRLEGERLDENRIELLAFR